MAGPGPFTCASGLKTLLLLGWVPVFPQALAVHPALVQVAGVRQEAATRRIVSVIPPVELDSDDSAVSKRLKKVLVAELERTLDRSGRYRIAERTDPAMLVRILDELAFQNSGLVATDQAKALGQLAGIDTFVRVRGRLDVGWRKCRLRLECHFIEVETSLRMAMLEVQAEGMGSFDPDRSAEDAVHKAMEQLAGKLGTD